MPWIRIIHFRDWQNQKQPFRGILRKKCSENMLLIYRKAPMPSSILPWTLVWVFCKFSGVFRTLPPRTTSAGLQKSQIFKLVFQCFIPLYQCNKHSNCPGFAGIVLDFGILSRCPKFNQIVPVFRFLTKKLFNLYSHNLLSVV